MQQASFKHINIISNAVLKNNLFTHYHFPEFLNRYDSNFIEFHQMPSLQEFTNAEDYLREFHLSHGQKHLKFKFPDNEKPASRLFTYLTQTKYEIGWLELYAINPVHFPFVNKQTDIIVKSVTDNTLDDYLELQYEQDIQFGKEFAHGKRELLKQQYTLDNIMQIIAYYKGIPAGYIDVVVSDQFVEIEVLHVKEMYQKRGIGRQLQRFVMDTFIGRTVILVADGEDTPKEMYKKQNYKFIGKKYEIFKMI